MVIGEKTLEITKVAFGNQILVLISAPLLERVQAQNNGGTKPVKPLAVYEELEAIITALRKSRTPVKFEIKVEIATQEALRRILTSGPRPLILHFIGHGTVVDQKVALVLEDEVGLARPLDVDTLRRMLQPLRSPPCRLALLNACHSQDLANVLVDAGVSHVVAVKATDTILDRSAHCFAQYFYPALLSKQSVIDAFYYSRDALIDDETLASIFDEQTYRSVNWDEALKFRLLPEDSSEHQRPLEYEPILGTPSGPKWENTNISPVSPDPFIGRRIDLYTIARLMRDRKLPRCLLLQGMGGMGKTALALASARWHHERHRWTDGVWLIEFRNVNTASQASDRIAAVLGLKRGYVSLANALNEKHILLILDDLDMLLNSDPEGAGELLCVLLGCSQVHLLVTARRSLPGKVVHNIYTLKRMGPTDALITFQNYAPPLRDWGVSNTRQEDQKAIMSFLDGYPFPIRLAATYMKQTRCSLRSLRQQLEANPFDELIYVGEKPDRDTSLYATLNLSYHVLPPGARDTFPLLALFPAGLTEDAARVILDDASVKSLENLLRFSMAEETEREPVRRFALPEPARRFAESYMPVNAIERHGPRALSFYYEFVKRAFELLAGADYEHGRWLLTVEQPNIRSFLDWGYEHEVGRHQICVSARLTVLLVNFWELTASGQYQSAKVYLDRALQAAERNKDNKAEADLHRSIGDVHCAAQDAVNALKSYVKAADLYQTTGERLSEARARNLSGDMLDRLRKKDEAVSSYEIGLRLYKGEADSHEGQEKTLLSAIENLTRDRTDEHIAAEHGEKLLRLLNDIPQYRNGVSRSLEAYAEVLRSYKAAGQVPDSEHTQQTFDTLSKARKTVDERLNNYIRLLRTAESVVNPGSFSVQ